MRQSKIECIITLTIAFACIVLSLSAIGQDRDENLVDAIWAVETNRAPDGPILGDNGRSRGPLQIQRAAWIDANLPDGTYEDCDRLEYATRVFWAYTDRYAGKNANNEDRARCWNSGPQWKKKKHLTDGYWKKVKKVLESP